MATFPVARMADSCATETTATPIAVGVVLLLKTKCVQKMEY